MSLRELIRRLKKESVTMAKFDGRSISFLYDGKIIRFRVVKRGQVCHVGDWSRSKPEIYFDSSLMKHLEIESLCIHEGVEKFVAEKYGLDVDKEAHMIASAVERKWLKRHGGDWKSYSRKVNEIWKKRGKH